MKHLSLRLGCVLVASVFVACSSDNNNNNHPDAGGGNVVNVDPTMTETQIASAFSGAAADSTIQMAAGTYHFTNSLSLATRNNITVKGAGMATTILDFSGQTAGADGLVQSIGPGSTVKTSFQDFSIRDTAGDGLKVTGATGLHVNHVGVSWPTRATHGGYGIYPVSCKQVLIENSTSDGASDTGIYVGQSDGIVVRNNVLTNNVAGIEIENSFNADVTGNDCHGNTVGFLVFDLPALPQVGGHNVRVYNNTFNDNNHPNFGDPSGTVALVPAGTGGPVMANSKVEVFGNTFSGNSAAGFSSISCFAALSVADCTTGATSGYNPFPTEVNVHDNTFTDNGADPLQGNTDDQHPSFQLAALLASGFLGAHPWADTHVSDVSYDGILSPLAAGQSNPYQICAKNNGSGHFADLHLDQWQQAQAGSQTPVPLGDFLTFDEQKYDCQLTALPAVPVPTF